MKQVSMDEIMKLGRLMASLEDMTALVASMPGHLTLDWNAYERHKPKPDTVVEGLWEGAEDEVPKMVFAVVCRCGNCFSDANGSDLMPPKYWRYPPKSPEAGP